MGRRKKVTSEASAALKTKIVSEFQREQQPTITALAKKHGVSRQYISQVLSESDVAPGQATFVSVSDTINTILEMSGLTVTALAELLDISRITVSNWSNDKIQAKPSHARRLELLLTALQHARSSKK